MRNKSIKIILFILLLSSVQNVYSQFDTLFWFAAPEVSQSTLNFDRPIYLWLSSSSIPSQVTISQPANNSFTPIIVNLNANSTQYVDLTPWIDQIETKPTNQVLNYGIKINATNPINAYYEILSLQCMCDPEIYVLKGKNSLGNNFLIPMQNMLNNANHPNYVPVPYSSFVIVATEDSTNITITPSVNISGHNANIPFTVILNTGQTYSATAISQSASQHLNGSIVVSNKPIAVTINDDLIYGGVYGTCADVAGDQIIPVEDLGTKYIVVRGFLTYPYDKVFILATQNNTNVMINGVLTTTLNSRQTYMYSMNTNNAAYIESNNPIYVLQMSGFGCEIGNCLVPQIECSGSQSVTFTRSTSDPLHLMLIVPNGAEGSFQINGNSALIPASQFYNVPGTSNTWKYAKITFTTSQIPVGVSTTVTNSSERFHLGMIHGTSNNGCRFGFFSDFSRYQYEISSNGNRFCEGDTLSFTVNSFPGATYSWIGPNGFVSNSQNPQIQNLNTNNQGLYIVNGSVENCSVIPDSIYIQIDTLIQPSLTSNGTQFCTGDTLRIFTNVQDGISYSLQTPFGSFTNIDSIVNYNITEMYEGHYFLNNFTNVCPINIDTILIQVDSMIHAEIFCVDSILCFGDALIMYSDLNINSNLYWIQPNGVINTNDSIIITHVNNSDQGFYIIDGVNQNCPFSPDSIYIQVQDTVQIQLVLNYDIFCEGDTLIINSTYIEGFQYQWTGPNGFSSQNQNVLIYPLTNLNSGLYILNGNNNNCPIIPDSVQVDIYPIPDISIHPIHPDICIGDTVCFNFTGANLYWYLTDTISNLCISPYTDTSITVFGSNQFGCMNHDRTEIFVHPYPIADFYMSSDSALIYYPNIDFYSNSECFSWYWNFGDQTFSDLVPPIHHVFPQIDTVYNVRLLVSNEFGCIDSIEKIVVIYDISFFFPNVITPNDDGYNDFFDIKNAEKINGTLLSIYDRWGKLIYKKENYRNDWNGEGFPSGNYYYVFEYLEKEYHSSLTIIK